MSEGGNTRTRGQGAAADRAARSERGSDARTHNIQTTATRTQAL